MYKLLLWEKFFEDVILKNFFNAEEKEYMT